MNSLALKLVPVIVLVCLAAARAQAAEAPPIGPTKIPFYSGNLSVIRFMMNQGTNQGPVPVTDWASPEHIEQLKRISCFADCDYQSWAIAEPEKGKWDFSVYESNADLLRAAGLGYIIFAWVHFPPKWFLESPEFVPYQCAEHGEKLMQLSPWAPNVWQVYRDFYAAQYRAMGSKIDWIRIATPSDYGEIGYPAAMTSWLVPQKHAHQGYWCGDPYARADFRDQMKLRFKTLAALNQRWGTTFASWDDVTYPELADEKGAKAAQASGNATDRRRWLDFIEWYYGEWTRFVPKLAGVIRGFYPKTPLIVSVGYASEETKFGNDYSLIPKMAKEHGIALQTPGNVAYYALKRVSTACHFHGCAYYTEPPGDVPLEAEIARVWSDVSNGVQVYFEYPQNLDRARAQLAVYKQHMTGARSRVDFAIFNATTNHRLHSGEGGFPSNSYMLGEKGRERFDYDVVDDYLARDGALAHYRLLAYVQGRVTERFALAKIAEWVKAGGVMVTCQMSDVETVEGDKSIWKSLVPAKLPALADVQNEGRFDWKKVATLCTRRVGRGMVIQLPVKGDQTDLLVEGVARAVYHLSDFDKSFRNAPLIDDIADGTAATLFADRILFFNWKDEEITKHIAFRPEDWAKRARKPEKMEFDLKIAPHSIEAVMLRP